MIVTVMGKMKKPYNIDGKSGVSCRLSLSCGEYINDSFTGQTGEGSQFIEVKCPEKIIDQVMINDELSVDLDDGKTRIKDAMFRNSDGSFSPISF